MEEIVVLQYVLAKLRSPCPNYSPHGPRLSEEMAANGNKTRFRHIIVAAGRVRPKPQSSEVHQVFQVHIICAEEARELETIKAHEKQGTVRHKIWIFD